MKQGFQIYDTDTHIDPGADVLEKYVNPGFRPRLDDLAPYRRAIKSRSVDGAIRHTYSFAHKAYERTLGEAETRPGSPDGRVWRGERRPSPESWTTAPTTAFSTWMQKARTCIFSSHRCGRVWSGCPTFRSKSG